MPRKIYKHGNNLNVLINEVETEETQNKIIQYAETKKWLVVCSSIISTENKEIHSTNCNAEIWIINNFVILQKH